ncbi:MAG: hypothetical protein RRX93_07830 [Bacteroidales bacterium]
MNVIKNGESAMKLTESKNNEFQKKIDAYKAKFGNLYQYEVLLDNGEKAIFILKQPSRKVLASATAAANGDSMKYNEIVLKNSVVDGDVSLLEEDSIFYGLSSKLEELISIKIGELKKL